MEKEEWKDIEGYEGLYQVSTLGVVKSIDRIIYCGDAWGNMITKNVPGKTLKHAHYSNGYVFISLSKNGIVRQYTIHRLVALAFLPNPNLLPEVNHKYGDKNDNRMSSLEWMTRDENRNHAFETGLIDNRGAKNGYAKSITIQKDDFLQTFPTQREAAKFIGVKDVNIHGAKRLNHKCKGYKIF